MVRPEHDRAFDETLAKLLERIVPADVIACRRRWFEQNRDQVGTLSYQATHDGVLVHGG